MSNYPTGALSDPYAPWNVLQCPKCDEEVWPDEALEHLSEVHGIEQDCIAEDDR